MWGTGGKMMIDGNRSDRKKYGHSVPLSTTNSTRTTLRLNPGLCDKKPPELRQHKVNICGMSLCEETTTF
jgi:hypothetical protein